MSGKLAEIIESGRAPGVITSSHKVDPESVCAKAPKGLRELENEPVYKHGPARGARGIAKHFGMPVDFIKDTWARPFKPKAKQVAAILACLLALTTMQAGELIPGVTFMDGQTVSAAQLGQLVSLGTITTTFYIDKPIEPSAISSDYVLVYSPTLGGFFKITTGVFSTGLFQQQIQLAPIGTPGQSDLVPFFSQSYTNVESAYFSNFLNQVTLNLNPGLLNFAPTNSASSNTNVPALANWPTAYGSSVGGTNMPELLTWGTNGQPYQISLLSFETSAAGDLGTNLAVPYVFNEMFAPWTFYGYTTNIYGTNSGGYPAITNLWGYTTNFPIQHLYLTNTYNPTNSAQTLTDQDQVPIYSTQQKTNTTTTLQGLYEYLTNRNTLPPYTVARIQFSGNPATFTVTNTDSTTNLVHTTAATNFMSPTAVSFLFTGAATSQLPSSPQVTSNQIYYALWYPSFTNSFRLYTNYSTASAQTNWVTFTGAVGTPATMYWLTNYTSFNADAIQLVSGGAINTAHYEVCFRTAAANNLYYTTGTIENIVNNYAGMGLAFDYGQPQTTAGVFVYTWVNTAGFYPAPLVQVLINPQ